MACGNSGRSGRGERRTCRRRGGKEGSRLGMEHEGLALECESEEGVM